jgi:hypothetical protein
LTFGSTAPNYRVASVAIGLIVISESK